jgi:hypothetical protein
LWDLAEHETIDWIEVVFAGVAHDSNKAFLGSRLIGQYSVDHPGG